MASEVEICNQALAHLGDNATVSTITPPDGSAQAEHCARFYPAMRDSLLEMHTWDFAVTRSSLALLSTNATGWTYTYAAPANVLTLLAILDPAAPDDYSAAIQSSTWYDPPILSVGQYTPQPFQGEIDPITGADLILTNQVNATARYTKRVTDVTKFSPLFVRCLGWLLSAELAGPVMKGEAGAAAAARCNAVFLKLFTSAILSDSNNRQIKPRQNVAWMSRR